MPYGFNDDKSKREIEESQTVEGTFSQNSTQAQYTNITNAKCQARGMMGVFTGTAKIKYSSGWMGVGYLTGVTIKERAFGVSRAEYSIEQARWLYIVTKIEPNGFVSMRATNGVTSDETLAPFNFSVPFKAM